MYKLMYRFTVALTLLGAAVIFWGISNMAVMMGGF